MAADTTEMNGYDCVAVTVQKQAESWFWPTDLVFLTLLLLNFPLIIPRKSSYIFFFTLIPSFGLLAFGFVWDDL